MTNKIRKKAFGTHEIARMCHVTPPTAIRWIKDGMLSSFTTGGGHRRVWGADLVVFMREHNIPVTGELLDSEDELRILIVEDEAQNREVMRRVIKSAYPNAAVDEAADGLEAGYKIHSATPSLIVLDLQLPRVNGFMLCGMIRANARLRGIKILAITAYNTTESKEQILRAGADDFLGKPFETEEFLGKLSSLLDGGGRDYERK